MKKFPHYSQFDAKDCGAACIKMVSKFYGKNFTLDYLNKKCYTSREGVSLLGISDAMEDMGFKTIGGKLTLNNLINKALLPCIIHWRQEHFVVLYKIEKKNLSKKSTIFYIADPSKGLLSYNEEEF